METRFIKSEEYQLLDHFNKSEFHKPLKMDFFFLRRLDFFRSYIQTPLIISSSNEKRSREGSQHNLGLAVDILAPNFSGSLFDLYLCAERFGFTGIGIYPDWKIDDIYCGGLHLDKRFESRAKGARWIGRKVKGKNEYFKMSQQTLVDHGILGVLKR